MNDRSADIVSALGFADEHLAHVREILGCPHGDPRSRVAIEEADVALTNNNVLQAWAQWRWSHHLSLQAPGAEHVQRLLGSPSDFAVAVGQAGGLAAFVLQPARLTPNLLTRLRESLEASTTGFVAVVLLCFFVEALEFDSHSRTPAALLAEVEKLAQSVSRLGSDQGRFFALQVAVPDQASKLAQRLGPGFTQLYEAICGLLAKTTDDESLERSLTGSEMRQLVPALCLYPGPRASKRSAAYLHGVEVAFDSDRPLLPELNLSPLGRLRLRAAGQAILANFRDDGGKWWTARWGSHSRILSFWPPDRSAIHYDRMLSLLTIGARAASESEDRALGASIIQDVLDSSESQLDRLLICALDADDSVVVEELVRAFLLLPTLEQLPRVERTAPWLRTTAAADAGLRALDGTSGTDELKRPLALAREKLVAFETAKAR